MHGLAQGIWELQNIVLFFNYEVNMTYNITFSDEVMNIMTYNILNTEKKPIQKYL